VLAAATAEFGARGYDGTTTEAIARAVGVSQPYLFRLFDSKHALFLETVEHTGDLFEQAMRDAARGLRGRAAIAAMATRYRELLTDTALLRFVLQMYAASLHDEACREIANRRLAAIWRMVAETTGRPPDEIEAFLSRGMLLNVLTALGVPYRPLGDLPQSLAEWAQSSTGAVPDDAR
jgi:AcrR family transcriptional regulator